MSGVRSEIRKNQEQRGKDRTQTNAPLTGAVGTPGRAAETDVTVPWMPHPEVLFTDRKPPPQRRIFWLNFLKAHQDDVGVT